VEEIRVQTGFIAIDLQLIDDLHVADKEIDLKEFEL